MVLELCGSCRLSAVLKSVQPHHSGSPSALLSLRLDSNFHVKAEKETTVTLSRISSFRAAVHRAFTEGLSERGRERASKRERERESELDRKRQTKMET